MEWSFVVYLASLDTDTAMELGGRFEIDSRAFFYSYCTYPTTDGRTDGRTDARTSMHFPSTMATIDLTHIAHHPRSIVLCTV
jgi:hypothetical protein